MFPYYPFHLPCRRNQAHYQILLLLPVVSRRQILPFPLFRPLRVHPLFLFGLLVVIGVLDDERGGAVHFFGILGLEKIGREFVVGDFEVVFGGRMGFRQVLGVGEGEVVKTFDHMAK